MTVFAKYIVNQLTRHPEKKRVPLSQKALRGAIMFFAAMFILMFVSTAASEALVAQVATGAASGGIIDRSVSGQGVWVSGEGQTVRVTHEGLYIGDVFVAPGQAVKQGDKLYAYDISSVEQAKEVQATEIERLNLQIQDMRTGASDSAESAAFELESAQTALEDAQANLDAAKSQIVRDRQAAYDAAKSVYDAMVIQSEREIQTSTDNITELESKLNPDDPNSVAALDEAKQALSDLVYTWDGKLNQAKSDMDAAKNAYDSVINGQFNNSDIGSYEEAIRSAERGVETAEFAHGQAVESDGETNAKIGYQIDDIELTLKETIEKHDELDALVKNDGMVTATFDGIITDISIERGPKTTGDESITYSSEGLVFQTELLESVSKNIAEGDTVKLLDGNDEIGNLTVAGISPAPVADTEMDVAETDAVQTEPMFIVSCTGSSETMSLNKTVDFIIERADRQDIRIPITALRQDGTGYYVLIISEEQTVLGVQEIAKRVEVQLISHDQNYAAVNGSLSGEGNIIVSSNKPIQDGDRIAVMSDE